MERSLIQVTGEGDEWNLMTHQSSLLYYKTYITEKKKDSSAKSLGIHYTYDDISERSTNAILPPLDKAHCHAEMRLSPKWDMIFCAYIVILIGGPKHDSIFHDIITVY